MPGAVTGNRRSDLNPKSEARTTKQIRMKKIPMTKTNSDPIGHLSNSTLINFYALLLPPCFDGFEHLDVRI